MVDAAIKKSLEDGISDIQILSCATTNTSILSDYVSEETYSVFNKRIPFTTVKKFKGLEAEHVIMVDVNKEIFTNNSMLFYVGSSRAKLQLSIIATLNDDDCAVILNSFGSSVKKNDPKESLAKLLGCKQSR